MIFKGFLVKFACIVAGTRVGRRQACVGIVLLHGVVRCLRQADPIGNDLNFSFIWLRSGTEFLHTAIIQHYFWRLGIHYMIRIFFEGLSIRILCSVWWVTLEESTFSRQGSLRRIIRRCFKVRTKFETRGRRRSVHLLYASSFHYLLKSSI